MPNHQPHTRTVRDRFHRVRQRTRAAFYTFHLWAGLTVGLWLVLIGLTGAVLAWLPDLMATEFLLRYPPERGSASAMIPPSKAIEAMRQAYPTATQTEVWSFNYPASSFPYYYWTAPGPKEPGDDRYMMVIVDPYSARVYPPTDYYASIIGVITELHVALLLKDAGLIVNGIFAFTVLVMIVSGIWLWWPRTMNLLRRSLGLRRGVPVRRLLYDLHNIMGVYFSVLLLLLGTTAILMVIDNITKQGVVKMVDNYTASAPPAEPTAVPHGVRLGIDTLFHLARRAIGDGEISALEQPTALEAPFKVSFQPKSTGFLNGSTLFLDPYSGSVLARFDRSDGTAGQKTSGLVGDLHFGTYGGIWTQILYTIAGLIPLGLYITGIWRWWSRRRAKRRKSSPAYDRSPSPAEHFLAETGEPQSAL